MASEDYLGLRLFYVFHSLRVHMHVQYNYSIQLFSYWDSYKTKLSDGNHTVKVFESFGLEIHFLVNERRD